MWENNFQKYYMVICLMAGLEMTFHGGCPCAHGKHYLQVQRTSTSFAVLGPQNCL